MDFFVILFIYFVYFSFYITFEVIWNALAKVFGWYDVFKPKLILDDNGNIVNTIPKSKWRLEGFASIWVGLLGGFVGITLFSLFAIPLFMNNWFMIFPFALLSGFTITFSELLLGLLLDAFNIRPWDYSDEPFNFRGNISLFRSIGWVCMGFLVYFLNLGMSSLLTTF